MERSRCLEGNYGKVAKFIILSLDAGDDVYSLLLGMTSVFRWADKLTFS